MSNITSTNIRVGPGFYSAVKYMSETSGLSMGTIADMLIMFGLNGFRGPLKFFPEEVQQVVLADMLNTLGDLFKAIGPSVITDASLQALYRRLLNPDDEGK